MIVNRIKFSFLTALLPLAAAFLLGACSKWNEPEALQLKLSGAKDRDPQLWGRYMDVLRSYKSGSHYLTYAEFDNGAESPVNEGSFLRSLPDSLDIVALSRPDAISAFDREDIPLLKEKSTKVVLKLDYAAMATESLADNSALQSRLDRLTSQVRELSLDGFVFTGAPLYDGTPEQLAARKEAAALIVSKLRAAAGSTGLLIFEGVPEFLTTEDRAKLDLLIAPTSSFDNVVSLKLTMNSLLSAEGVSKEKVLLSAAIGGEIYDSNNSKKPQVPLILDYVASLGPLGGIALKNIGEDYSNPLTNYATTRGIISSMNPSR